MNRKSELYVKQKVHLLQKRNLLLSDLSKENGFEWIGEYDVTADDLLSGTAKGTKKQAAIDFLEEFVLNGAKPQTEIMKLAKEKGFSEKTVRNAKDELKIKSMRKNNQWYLSLN